MSFWSAIFKGIGVKGADRLGKAAGVVEDQKGWYYEESQNFSKSQSTVRIEQQRPGDWELLESSCGIVGLNSPKREKDVARFFAGSYRWLRVERDVKGPQQLRVKVVGTYRDKSRRDRAVHLGYLKQDVAEQIGARDVGRLWARIRFIKFPVPGRSSKYLIRFDLMKKAEPRRSA